MNIILKKLLSEEFNGKYFPLDLTDSSYYKLSRDESVIELREALKSGVITWDELREVVDHIADMIKPGFSLGNQTTLCAIAVAIEELPSQFTGEFFEVFSQSRAAAIGKISRMARRCIEYIKDINDS